MLLWTKRVAVASSIFTLTAMSVDSYISRMKKKEEEKKMMTIKMMVAVAVAVGVVVVVVMEVVMMRVMMIMVIVVVVVVVALMNVVVAAVVVVIYIIIAVIITNSTVLIIIIVIIISSSPSALHSRQTPVIPSLSPSVTVIIIISVISVTPVILCAEGVAVASSIFTLTAMSVDRYISIQHPMASLTGMTSRQAVAIVLLTWIVSAIFMGPLLYVRQVGGLKTA